VICATSCTRRDLRQAFEQMLAMIDVAVARIEQEYFQLSVADADAVYRERVLSFAKIVTVVREVARDPRATDVASRIAGIDERSTALAPLPVRATRPPQHVRSIAHVRLRVVRSDGVIRRLPGRRPLGLR
jgi:hypothetical protein